MLKSDFVIYYLTISAKESSKDKPDIKITNTFFTTLKTIKFQVLGLLICVISTFTIYPVVLFLNPFINIKWWYFYVIALFNIFYLI